MNDTLDDAQAATMSLKQVAHMATCCAIVAATMAGILFAGTSPSTYQFPSDSAVISYLLQSVNWYRHVYTERQLASEPADVMFLDDNQAIERQIVKLSFEFAKADAVLETSAASSHGRPATSDPPPADLAHFIELRNRNDQLSQQVVEEIKNLDKRLSAANGVDRRKLKAAEEDAQTRLQLLDAVAQGLNDLVEFVQSPSEGQRHGGHLDSTVDELSQSIPEVTGPSVSLAATPREAASRTAGRDAGILGLMSEVSAMKHKLRVVDENILLTDNLTLSANNLRIPLAGFVTQLIQSVAINNSQTSDLLSLREQKSHLDKLTLDLKELSPVIVALDNKRSCWQSTSHTCCPGELQWLASIGKRGNNY